MMKKLIVAPLAVSLLVYPSMAAAPQFQTNAPIAYMEDLSSGAVLFQRDAERRMPPASMS
jgi:D-alanyl-D-alanine carboxypeptidase (penicillin-binding protein 5/6)